MKGLLLALLGLAIAFPVAAEPTLDEVLVAPHRSPEFVARDRYRKPRETLEFLGLKPHLTVVEIWPGGGYWTEILAPYLRPQGTYYTAISPSASSERSARAAERWHQKLTSRPDLYDKVRISEFGMGHTDVAPANSADLVLTFRNVHNWVAAGLADDAFAAFFKALKPGGILGVGDHRAPTDRPQDPQATSGYVREDYVRQLAERAGFEFVESSELLANPKDTKDWPKGVWTLPPTLILGEQDRDKYLAIGEADNFLLKFRKPAKKE
jgi:predicted methyltransferase